MLYLFVRFLHAMLEFTVTEEDVWQTISDFQPDDQGDYYFISYNSEDTERTAEICRTLHKSIPLWYDYGIPYDSEWETVINKRIRTCRKVILFYTNGILKKKDSFVIKEYEAARFRDKEVLLVMLEEINKAQVPDNQLSFILELMKRQSVQAYGKSTEAVCSEIMRALGVKEASFTARTVTEQRTVSPVKKAVIHPNDLCPCGSGRKYKFCHGRRDIVSVMTADSLKAGDFCFFGHYPQSADGKAMPVEWQVLKTDGNKALLISRCGLDTKKYNTDRKEKLTWSQCTLRSWLNHEFLIEAFTAEEKQMLAITENINPKNPKYGTEGGRDTHDVLFLLSIDEAKKYFQNDSDRKCEATESAKMHGAYTGRYGTSCWWWLRSPGHFSNFAAFVYDDGTVHQGGLYVDCENSTVRPAIWINLGK